MPSESRKAFELGVYTFGNTPRTANGGYEPTAQALRNVLEAVHVAEEVGLDFFGFGEHHTRSMPLSSPTAMVSAAAASTQRIKLGTTVTVVPRPILSVAVAAAVTSEVGDDSGIPRVWCSPKPKKSSPTSSATRTASMASRIAWAVAP